MRRLNPQLVDWLHQWGDDEARPCKYLGYPNMTQEARLTASPGRSTTIDHAPDFRINHVAATVRAAVKEIRPVSYQALWWQYVQNRGPAKVAEYFQCSRDAAVWKIETAHREVAIVLKISLYSRR